MPDFPFSPVIQFPFVVHKSPGIPGIVQKILFPKSLQHAVYFFLLNLPGSQLSEDISCAVLGFCTIPGDVQPYVFFFFSHNSDRN